MAELPGLSSSVMSSDALARVLDGCHRNDEAAWREPYEAHVDFLYHTAQRLGTPAEEVEDVVHDVFMVVFRRLHTFTHGRITTWLYRICANVAADHRRKRRVRDTVAGLKAWIGMTAPESPDCGVERRAEQRAVQEIMAKLEPKKREVLVLYELEGLSGEEIAELLGCPLATVWTRLRRARSDFEKHSRRADSAGRRDRSSGRSQPPRRSCWWQRERFYARRVHGPMWASLPLS